MGLRNHIDVKHSAHLNRRGHARTTGLLVAAGIALLSGGVVGWFMLKAPQAPMDQGTQPAIPELPDSSNQPGTKGRSQLDAMGQNSGPFMQFADRRDPTRVAGEITADRAEPLEGRRYRLDAPKAWSFLRDGRTLLIEAKTARASFAEAGAKGRPEEATLEGEVTVRLFAATADGSRPDPAKDGALFTAKADELRYDGTLGRLLIPSSVVIKGERISFEGSDITLLFNEANESIDALKISRTKSLEFTPQAAAPAAAGSNSKKVTSATDTSPAATADGKVVEYCFSGAGEVTISRGTQRITGDLLKGWIRTVDNRIPERLFAPIALASREGSHRDRGPASIPGLALMYGSAPIAPGIDDAESQTVRVSFQGPFELTPLSQTVKELDGEDACVRVGANAGGFVVATDERSRSTVKAASIEYGAGRQSLALVGDEARAVTVNVPGQGSLHAQDVRVDMKAGKARIVGIGHLARTIDSDESQNAGIAWTRDVEIDFIPGSSPSDLRITRAEFNGSVAASEKGGAFSADRVVAEFDAQTDQSAITRAELVGGAKASNNDGASLAADRIDVRFAQGASTRDITPRRLEARGSVIGVRASETFRAGELNADLIRNEEGKTVVAAAEASTGIEYSNADGMRASAQRMSADPVAGFVELSGEGSTIAKGETKITSSKIRLFADERRIEVPVAGRFAHTEPAKAGEAASLATVSWKSSMTFNDGLGRAECIGETRAELTKGEFERSSMDAHRVTVLLEPAGGEGVASRKIARVEADGGESLVKLEARRYVIGKPDTLSQLLYLESAKVIALGIDGVIEVPQEGKLLAVDRRPSKLDGGRNTLESTGRGDALFRWKKSLAVDRAKGELRMSGEVQLDHRTLEDGSRVRLECDTLTAYTDTMPASTEDSGVGQLRKAIATGKVWMRGMGRELTAAEVAYDAKSALVTAAGGANSKVNVVDTKSGSPFAARWLNWELNTGRIEALSTDPMIVPR